MAEKPKKVVIVTEGSLGKGNYESTLRRLTRAVEFNGKGQVKMVDNETEAVDLIKQGDVDSLVFVSGFMVPVAQKIQEQYPDIVVSVFGGRFPESTVVLVDKTWGFGRDNIGKIILKGLSKF